MSFENPTALRIGVSGTLDGRRLRVAGRVVVGMEDEGETYYWQEFNLVDGFGRNVTLVYEEGENGPEWKLFKFFEPLRPISVAEAEAKRVGHTINLDGTSRKITLVDESRIYHIEGTAAEGVEVGDVANYFNVDSGDRMLVASWTGDEVEYYEGRDLSTAEVGAAFGFEATESQTSSLSGFRGQPMAAMPGWGAGKWFGAALAALALVFSFLSCGVCRSSPRSAGPPPAKRPAPAARLTNGAHGTIGAHSYTITSHAVREIGRVGSRFDRHEYQLVSETRERALLINGLDGSLNGWHLLTPAPRPPQLDPYTAATRRKGAPVVFESHNATITELFFTKTLSSDGEGGTTAWPAVQYGFVARDTNDALVARWTETAIEFHQGRSIPENEVRSAFASKPASSR